MDLEAQIGERRAQRRDDLFEVRGEIRAVGLLVIDRSGRGRLLDIVEIAAVEHPLEPLERMALSCSAVIPQPPVSIYSNAWNIILIYMGPVKTRQQIAAEETQRVIVQAAARLFLERGYHATSIGQIAAEAGVAIQTIYNSVGSKRDVLSRVLDFAAAGERAPVPVAQFMREQAERESDPHRLIEQLVEFWHGALPRTAPVFRVLREAAAIDPDAAALERERSAQRLHNYELAASCSNSTARCEMA